jgi:DNA-binding response OmpR family regulator
LLAGADDYVAKPFNARELIARGQYYCPHECDKFDLTITAHMQLQIGKKRKSLEEAFDTRTAELRVLSERAYPSFPARDELNPD